MRSLKPLAAPFKQALGWCRDGTITDASTLIGLFRAQALHGKRAGDPIRDLRQNSCPSEVATFDGYMGLKFYLKSSSDGRSIW